MKLVIRGMSFDYEKKKVLKDLSMGMKEGEFVTILGPSGSGKSTILKILAGVLDSEQGEIYVDGKRVNGVTPYFAYMPQDDLLFPWNTILENVCLYAAIHGGYEKAREEALRSLDAFGLGGYENAYPKELSGGMRQRAAFLRTSMSRGDIMLLDEPFGALDVITRGDMQDWLGSMRKRLDKTTLLVTHDIDEAIYLSDRILILSHTPSYITREIQITETKRTREWLYGQTELRTLIYNHIKGEQRDETL